MTYFRLFRSALLGLCLLSLSGCEGNASQEPETKAQMDEMQAEIRLLVKEVVSLNKKLDSVLASRENAGRGNQGKRATREVSLPENPNILGDPKASYAMIEFMDYQCPYCVKYAKQVLPAIKQRYVDSGKLQYLIRDYPLAFHKKAKGAAIAANCAGSQDKYWQMHDELIVNSRSLSDGLYSDLAQKLNLDMESFKTCLQLPEMAAAVDSDLDYGTEIGTRGTPNFYIGKIVDGKIVDAINISGARSVEAFDRAIQQVLSRG
ncbi:hypothetical protein EYS14_13630 [Alteromonadaceae bacterium M269]|nr:hypothetical protein EYS14_13630 [Alteromonadaceae bacterium M269]